MVDESEIPQNQSGDWEEGFFVVRNVDAGGKETYAICVQVASDDGSAAIFGTGKTARQIVVDGNLRAAFVSGGLRGDFRNETFRAQSGRNVTIVYSEK